MIKADAWKLTENEEFIRLVRINMALIAMQVCGEAAGSLGAEQLIKRHNEAYKVIENPFPNIARYVLFAASKPLLYGELTIESNDSLSSATQTPDEHIDDTIFIIWDDMSGVSAADKV